MSTTVVDDLNNQAAAYDAHGGAQPLPNPSPPPGGCRACAREPGPERDTRARDRVTQLAKPRRGAVGARLAPSGEAGARLRATRQSVRGSARARRHCPRRGSSRSERFLHGAPELRRFALLGLLPLGRHGKRRLVEHPAPFDLLPLNRAALGGMTICPGDLPRSCAVSVRASFLNRKVSMLIR